MNQVAFWGAVEIGLIYGLVGIGVYLSFRVLDFPDLTVDGSFALGAAVTAILIVSGFNPYLATFAAMIAGSSAGLVTAFLNLRFGILHLLASILTMTALYTINLRVMGRPNVALITEPTVITPFEGLGLSGLYLRPLAMAVVAIIAGLLVVRFLASEYGLAMRATGVNKRMARAQGISTDQKTYAGMALSNALVALAGALFAMTNGFADISMGVGTIVVGLAAVIIGETILPGRALILAVVGCIIGSILYRIAIALALNSDALGFTSSDLNLVTALLVAVALILPRLRANLAARMKKDEVT